MSAQHTTEPWKYEEEAQGTGGGFTRYFQTVKGADGNNIVRISAKTGEADCRRIVACVNACAGIDTAFLIAWAHGVQMNNGEPWSDRIDANLSEIQALKRQSNDLAREVMTLTVELGKAKQQRDDLRAEAEKYHTQLIECKHRWDAMKQQRDELQAKCDELRERYNEMHAPCLKQSAIIVDLLDALALCKHEACFSIGPVDAIQRQLGLVQRIAEDAIAKARG